MLSPLISNILFLVASPLPFFKTSKMFSLIIILLIETIFLRLTETFFLCIKLNAFFLFFFFWHSIHGFQQIPIKFHTSLLQIIDYLLWNRDFIELKEKPEVLWSLIYPGLCSKTHHQKGKNGIYVWDLWGFWEFPMTQGQHPLIFLWPLFIGRCSWIILW